MEYETMSKSEQEVGQTYLRAVKEALTITAAIAGMIVVPFTAITLVFLPYVGVMTFIYLTTGPISNVTVELVALIIGLQVVWFVVAVYPAAKAIFGVGE